MNLKEFIAESKRRKVISSLSLYAISSWMLIQVAATTFPYLGFPKIAITGLIILVLIFLPVIILFSWFYNVVPDPDPEKGTVKKHRVTIISFASILSLIIIILIFKLLSTKDNKETISSINEDKIAVAIFDNFTQNPKLDIVGKMAADWISHGIVKNDISAIIDYESLQDYENLSMNKFNIADPLSLSKLLGGNLKIIRGSYYQSGNKIIFQCRISGSDEKEKDFAFENVEVNIGDELNGIENLKQKILSFLSPRKESEETGPTELPRYDAYQYFLQAKEKWGEDYTFIIASLNKAIELNPDFHEATNFLVSAYYNTKQFAKADSLLDILYLKEKNIDNNINFSVSQKGHQDYMRAVLNGENGIAAENHKILEAYNPTNKTLNVEGMLTAMEFVNNPQLAIDIYNRLPEENFDYPTCNYCLVRRELKAKADLMLGRSKDAIKNLEELTHISKRRKTFEILVKAYAQQEKLVKLDALLDKAEKNIILDSDWRYLVFTAAVEFKLNKKQELASQYAEKALNYYNQGKPLHKMLGRINLIAGNYEEAKLHFESFLSNRPSDTYSMSKLSQIYFYLGDEDKSKEYLDRIDGHEKPYQFGMIDYYKAGAYANTGEEALCIESLNSAVQKGRKFNMYNFKNDPDFIPMFDHPEFIKAMNYWK